MSANDLITPRARRLIGVALSVTLVLIAGRAMTDFLAAEWWSGAISAAALRTTRNWRWLGIALDATAVVIASLWFVVQALLVARAIASVQVQREVGGLSVREVVPTRLLISGAVATGILLGLLTGTGAARWREPVALAWQGVHYGVNDPVLGSDLGLYVAAVPLWDLAHGFATLLMVLGLGFVAMLYLGAGALRFKSRRMLVHPYAQRHLGGLLTLAALVICWGYLIKPYHLVIDTTGVLDLAATGTRIVAAYALAGASLAVAIMTARWAVQARHSLFLAGWTVLAVAILGERLIVPAFVTDSPRTEPDSEAERQMVGLAYAVTVTTSADGSAALPSTTGHDLWDPGLLAIVTADQGARLISAAPIQGGNELPWRVVAKSGGDSNRIEIRTIAGGSISPDGLPIDLTKPITIENAASIPGDVGWRVKSHGVTLGTPARRGALAWALQAPGLLTNSDTTIDWQLDPITRLGALMPALSWQLVGSLERGEGAEWLLLGLATIDRVPYGVPTLLMGRIVEGAVPAVVALVSMRTGGVRAWVDPAAESLGRAWARIYRPLVGAAGSMPDDVSAALPYSAAWMSAQLTALRVMDRDRYGWSGPVVLGHRSGKPVVATFTVDSGPPRQRAIVVGQRKSGGGAVLREDYSPQAGLSATELSTGWHAKSGLAHVRDSLHAAGDSLIAGPLHRLLTHRGLESWQVFASSGRRGAARVLWLGTSTGLTISGGPQPQAAWVSRDSSDAQQARSDPAIRLRAVRGWIQRGDSALARRDMTAFGRAWEALRALMLTAAPE